MLTICQTFVVRRISDNTVSQAPAHWHAKQRVLKLKELTKNQADFFLDIVGHFPGDKSYGNAMLPEIIKVS
jgi:hypothetical protein